MVDLASFGVWVVEHPVGRGAMATVYRCHHRDDPTRLAAVKVLHATDDDRGGERLGRFAREVRVLRRLEHPGIVRVLDAGIHEPEPWIALELVRGQPLHVARPGRRDPAEVVVLGLELAEALVHAHRVGVFHRDVKPSNVLIDGNGRVRLVDFGIAVALDEAAITDPDRLGPGTLAYSPPEWFRSVGDYSPALADAYALGVVLWELLTGERAFRATDAERRLASVFRQKARVPLLDPGEEVPPALRSIVMGLTTGAREARLPLEEAQGRLVAARAAGLGDDTARMATSHTNLVPLDLPEPADTFVGREAELDTAEGWIVEGSRLVTLTGPGGVGKTRLAVRLAERLAPDHLGGTLLCELSAAQDLDGIQRALGRALRVPLVEGDAGDQLQRALRGRGRALLVLDNVEQVVDLAAAQVTTWLQEAPELRIVVTSRERLRVAGERVLPVPPLAVPVEGADPEQVALSEGVRLLVARAREVDAGFRLTADNAEALAAVVRAVDGLPLALELAAARTQVLDAQKLAERASDPLALLAGGRRGGPERHGTLRATLDWSWELLDPEGRSVLAQCSVFEGAFPLDAAEAVLDAPPGTYLLDVLQGLVERSLLQVRRHEGGFGMLRTVRAYAAEQLGDALDLRRRHAEWFARVADAPSRRTLPPSEAEVDNARAACDWAISAELPTLALRTALVVGDSAFRSGPLMPEADRLERALALPGGEILDRIRVGLRLGGLLERSLRSDLAQERVDEALALLEGVSDPLWQGRALAAAARVGWLQRAPEATVDLLERAIRLLRDARDGRELAHALALRANVQWSLRQPLDQARLDLEEAAAILDAQPDPYVLTIVLGVRALVLGEPLDRVIRLARRSGYVAIRVDAECMAGIDAVISGELDRAEGLLRRALQGARRYGFLGRHADILCALADVALRRGRFAEADLLCRDVLELRGEDEHAAHPAICNQLGLVAAGLGRAEDARRWFRRADQRAAELKVPLVLRVETLAIRASILADLGDPGAAAEALAGAEDLAGRTAVDPATMAGRMLERARRDVAG